MNLCRKKLHLVDYSLSKQCSECKKAAKAIWNKNNPERIWIMRRREYQKNKSNYSLRAKKNHERRTKDISYVLKERTRKADLKKRNPARAALNERIRREAIKLRTPKWLSEEQLEEIKEFYFIRAELSWLSEGGLEVDHIIPLQGKIVSGLHVPWNLRIIARAENLKKANNIGGY